MEHQHHTGHHMPEMKGPDSPNSHSDKAHTGHNHHGMIQDFKKRFWISLAITIPVLLLSEMIQMFFHFHLHFFGDTYLLFALSTIVFFYGGWPFLKGLKDEIGNRNPGMMTLIGMAITVAYVYSTAVVFGLTGMDFYWELATLIVIMLLGHWIEMKSVMGASRSLELLVGMMPAIAHKIHGTHVMDIQLEELVHGDMILVKPGEKIPADGVVMEGESYVNESMLTGESKPNKKNESQKVIGGSINGSGALKIQVLHTGKDSYLNKVISMVQEAQRSKSRMQNLSNRAARWLTVIALSAGILTLVVWLISGREFSFALERMVTVMVISCPHALGLAVPLVVAISTAVSAQNGLLIRNRTAFEASRKITAILFDKTGTLTKGEFEVTRIESYHPTFGENEILEMAAALEQSSGHPIASGILKKAKELDIQIPEITEFNSIPGKGISAQILNKKVQIVSPGYLTEFQIAIPKDIPSNAAETLVYLLEDNNLIGRIALADIIRPESLAAIQQFKADGIQVWMATGDNHKVAESVSKELGLDGFYAEVLPHQKVEIVKKMQQAGEFVAMTGDGVNDAPALAQADVGIAVGSGTDVAAETADIILVNSNPQDILNLIIFGKDTYRKMVQNLFWATAYNSISIPLGAGVLYTYGIMMSPAVGAVLMSLSTIIVAANAQLLHRKFKRRIAVQKNLLHS
ncbi:MAG: copper-translocating P-type ATPase [Bacteroidetes bacterium]|nr:copper-translocating P-type ATPase [Bacteroidota bacterium]